MYLAIVGAWTLSFGTTRKKFGIEPLVSGARIAEAEMNGSRSAPSTAESRWISYDASPTDRVPRAPKESALTMCSSFHSRVRLQQVGRTTVDGLTSCGRRVDR